VFYTHRQTNRCVGPRRSLRSPLPRLYPRDLHLHPRRTRLHRRRRRRRHHRRRRPRTV